MSIVPQGRVRPGPVRVVPSHLTNGDAMTSATVSFGTGDIDQGSCRFGSDCGLHAANQTGASVGSGAAFDSVRNSDMQSRIRIRPHALFCGPAIRGVRKESGGGEEEGSPPRATAGVLVAAD